MTQTTLVLTFQDFIARVAEYLGVSAYGTSVAAKPTDTHDLDVCKRLVNDGFRRFFNSNPRWNWVKRLFTITFDPNGTSDKCVGGENWRYYMPNGFYGQILGWITYGGNTGISHLVRRTEQEIRAARSSAETSGEPGVYDVRPLAGDDAGRWEIVVWPGPSSARTVTGKCLIYPNKLIEDGDVLNCGPVFDEAVLAAALAEAERQREDSSGLMESNWAESLVRAIAIDQRTAPTTVGYNADRSDDIGPGRRRGFSGVDSYVSGDGNTYNF